MEGYCPQWFGQRFYNDKRNVRKKQIVSKSTEEKLLQVANLSPDEAWIERIVDVHPMKQVAIMTVVQVLVFFFMLGVMAFTNLFL